jgi:hypothetical protein
MEVDEFLHTLKYIAFFEGILTLPSDVHIWHSFSPLEF